jgi:hypothetical protein
MGHALGDGGRRKFVTQLFHVPRKKIRKINSKELAAAVDRTLGPEIKTEVGKTRRRNQSNPRFSDCSSNASCFSLRSDVRSDVTIRTHHNHGPKVLPLCRGKFQDFTLEAPQMRCHRWTNIFPLIICNWLGPFNEQLTLQKQLVLVKLTGLYIVPYLCQNHRKNGESFPPISCSAKS